MKKRLMLWGYLLVLGWLLLFGRRPGAPGQGSFVPFLGVWRVYLCWRNVGFRLAIIPLRELVGNVLLFLPLGILLGREKFWQGRPFRMLLTGALLSTVLEILQWTTGLGVADVDDVICNTLGAFLGWLLRQEKNRT